MFGFFIIDKPSGISSRNALDDFTKLCRPAKVGHAGTLDPLATGVLVACVGPATRLVSHVQQLPKKYTATFRLGVESESEDIETELVPIPTATEITKSQLLSTLREFVGRIEQLPPRFSALRVNGKRAYQLARRGTEFELQPRSIDIYRLELNRFDYPDFEIEVECGSGTYVRSLGRDIGRALNSGAVMTALKRTAIGNFTLSHAHDALQLRAAISKNTDSRFHTMSSEILSPNAQLLGLTEATLDEKQAAGLINAVGVQIEDPAQPSELAARDSTNRLLAILQLQSNGIYTPKINFAKYWLELDRRS